MKIHKKILSLFIALSVIFSTTVSAFALDQGTISGNSIWDAFIKTVDLSSNNISDYMTAYQFTQQWVSTGNAQATFTDGTTLTTPKKYFRSSTGGGSFQGSNNQGYFSDFESGDTSYQPFISESYNTTNNNYAYTFNYLGDTYNIDSINYNTEYNTYEIVTNETNYYITYSPTYVSVMYYDPVEEYSVRTDIYYMLPDGRNSYDLTADEVWGTYFIYNAVNYDEVVEDDGITLRLYHLDGNFNDSSYYNTPLNRSYSNFYEGIFDGSLYVNNTSYSFPVVVDVDDDLLLSGYTIEFWVNNQYTSFKLGRPYLNSSLTCSSLSRSITGIPQSVWSHIAITVHPLRSGSSYSYYDFEIYVDGVDVTEKNKNSSVYIGNYFSINNDYITDWNTHIWNFESYSSDYIFYLDEIRVSKGVLYSDNFIRPSQPFDTNLVLVLPDSGTDNDIAVKSNTPVTSLRVGGVRPTYPTNGYVYVYLEDDVVKDVQQYQTDGWYSVDACIYQDEQWVNLYNTDLSAYVLEDDTTNDNTGDNTTDSDSSGNTTGGDTTTDEDETTGLLSSIMSTISNFITGLLDILFGGILDLITIVTDNLTGIIDGFSGIIDLLGALFGFLPEQMTSVLTAGLAVIIICVIIKIFI